MLFCYLMITGFLLFTNAITNGALTVEQSNQHGIAGRIISIGIYAAAAYMIAAVPIELIWLRYCSGICQPDVLRLDCWARAGRAYHVSGESTGSVYGRNARNPEPVPVILV